MPIDFGIGEVITSLIWTGPAFASGNGATVLAWRIQDNTATDPFDALALRIANEWGLNLRSIQDDNMTLSEVRWESLTSSGSYSDGRSGQSSAPTAPSNSAALVSYYGALKGRRNRGRSYWPGFLSENLVDEGGRLDGTFVGSLATAFGAFFAAVESDTVQPVQCIAQSTHPEQKSPPISPWPEVNTRVVRSVVGTQRRRVRP